MKKILTFLSLVLVSTLVFVFLSKPVEVKAATDVESTVPEASMQNLAWDSESGYCYVTATSTTVVKYTVNEAEGVNNKLTNATDLAIRIYASYSQQNRPNNGNALCWVRIKFKESDTVYGISKAVINIPMMTENGKKMVLVSNGGDNNLGGQLNFAPGTDGTIYVPLSQFMDGKGLEGEGLGNSLTSVEGYQNLTLEYVEYTFSANRYEWAFGPIAVVRQADSNVTIEKQNVTGTCDTAKQTLYKGMIYDKANFKVNGTAATKEADGLWSVTLEGIGKVEFPYDETKGVYAFSPVKAKLIAEGYGITGVSVKLHNQEAEGASNWTLALETYNKGYFMEGEIPLRKGFRSIMNDRRNGAATVWEAQEFDVELTVSKLAKVELVNVENAPVAYRNDLYNVVAKSGKPIQVDDSTDGVLYLKPSEEASVVIQPKSGFVYRGYKLGDAEDTETTETTVKLTVAADTTLEVLGVGEEVTIKAEAQEHGSIAITGLADGAFTSNVFANVTVTVTPDKGYYPVLKVQYTTPAAEEGAEPTVEEVAFEPNEEGAYIFNVTEKCKTSECKIIASFEVEEYTLTYRLNGGEYEGGETNPETVTYFDTVELKPVYKDGYDFKGWRAEGSTDFITTLENVEDDLTIIAVFEIHEEPDTPVDPVTQPPVVTTKAPVVTTKAPDTTTKAPATPTDAPSKTDAPKKGCKNALVPSILGVAFLLGSIVVIKKKREE